MNYIPREDVAWLEKMYGRIELSKDLGLVACNITQALVIQSRRMNSHDCAIAARLGARGVSSLRVRIRPCWAQFDSMSTHVCMEIA